MKYIKRFNEINEAKISGEFTSEIRKICNDYLAYLIDDNYKISVAHKVNKENIVNILISKSSLSDDEQEYNRIFFECDEVKYDIIPFYENLIKNYDVELFRIIHSKSYKNMERVVSDYYNKNQIISDKITTKECSDIIIQVNKRNTSMYGKFKKYLTKKKEKSGEVVTTLYNNFEVYKK